MPAYFSGITDKGNRRERNEDAFVVRKVFNKNYVLACVIDGVGGYSGGDVAAGIARDIIDKYFDHEAADVTAKLKDAICAANAEIQARKEVGYEYQQMACVITCSVIDLAANKFYYAHVGDTRLYLFRDESLVKVTRDDSVVGYLEESGRLSESDAMNHPRRNEINKALGFEPSIAADEYIQTGESPFLPGDIILLCSDGLSDMISAEVIKSILSTKNTIEEKCRALIKAANDAGGNDNITAILVNNPAKQKKHEPVPPPGRNGKNSLVDTAHISKASSPKGSRLKLVLFLVISASILLGMLTPKFSRNDLRSNKRSIVSAVSKPVDSFLLSFSKAVDSAQSFSMSHKEMMVNHTVNISSDSFYLHGNGITFFAGKKSSDPAFNVSNSAHVIIFDNLVFKDFDIAIATSGNNIVLKNVRFINCRVPVQYNLSFRDTIVSGQLKDSVFTFN